MSQLLAKVCLDTTLLSKSLEPLIGFVAFLVPKLWLKNKFLVKNKNPTRCICDELDQML